MAPTLKIQNADGSYSAVMTLADIAEALGIQHGAARQRLYTGRLPEPALYVSSRPLWRREQIEEIAGRAAVSEAS